MKTLLLLAPAVILLLTSCTAQQRARNFGGTIEIHLPPSTKLVNATWKEDDLWYLHRPVRPGEVPEVITFQEESGSALSLAGEGRVIFHESK